MSLREIVISENTQTETRKRLVQVVFTEDLQIHAVWQVEKGKKHRELTVRVSESLRAIIGGRPGVQAVFDQIRDDTAPKAAI